MADDADRAQPNIDNAVEDGLAEARRAAPQAGDYTGLCHYCGAITGGGRRFCDSDCRDAWQHERDLKRMKGVA